MNDNRYLMAGICSIVLACLIPVYGFYMVFNFDLGYSASAYFNQLSFNLFDLVFPIIGVLGIYVYLNLNSILKEHNNYSGLQVPILLIIVTTVIFNFGLFIFDTSMYAFGEQLSTSAKETLVAAYVFVSIGSMMIFGVLDIIVGIILLVNNQKLDKLVVIYGGLSLLVGLLELTLVFSYGIIFIMPVALVVLAVHFMKKPDVLEVV